MEQVSMWKTKDGKIFSDWNKAAKHEQSLAECDSIQALAYKEDGNPIQYYDENPEQCDKLLAELKRVCKERIPGCDWQFDPMQYDGIHGVAYRTLSDYSNEYPELWNLYRTFISIKPSRENKPNNPKGKTYDNGEWVCIDENEQGWEYQPNNDPETYVSGSFTLDEYADKKVIDYDGCFELPQMVIAALTELGYDTEEVDPTVGILG